MGFYAITGDFLRNGGNLRLFKCALRGLFSCLFLRAPLWISLLIANHCSSRTQLAESAASRFAVAVDALDLADVEEVGVGDDGRLPLPTRQRAIRRGLSVAQALFVAQRARRAGADSLALRRSARPARAGPARRAAAPNARAARCRRRPSGGRSASPSGRSLGQSSAGSASSSTRPPARTQRVELDQLLRPAAPAAAPSAAAARP